MTLDSWKDPFKAAWPIMAAICAGRQGAQVTVFEAADRIGKTILATGNGRPACRRRSRP